MIHSLPVLLYLALFSFLSPKLDACTMILVGKNATDNGATLVAHTDDAGGGAADVRLVRVPAMDFPEGAQRSVYKLNGGFPRVVTTERGEQYSPEASKQPAMEPIGSIPQVRHTFGYFDQDYGMMNDKQLAIGETTCGARTAGWPLSTPGGKCLFGIAELSKIALERCETARCAVQLMGDLAVKHGFYSEDSGSMENPDYGDSAETLGLADRFGESWVFHVLTGLNNEGAVWAAQRIPADHVSVVANGFIIREMNLDDTDNFLASPSIKEIAQAQGWWDPKEGEFDFTAAYGYTRPGPLMPLYVGRRVWRVLDLVAPSLKLDSRLGSHSAVPTYPVSVKPDEKVTLEKVTSILKDYYQGTEYDLSKGFGAGPFGSPVRYDGSGKGVTGGWERSISMFRTMYSFVLSSRGDLPNEVGGQMWYGQGTPDGTVYVPFSCAQDTIPSSYLIGKESGFSRDSAWWAFKFVNNWVLLRYNIIMPDVREEQMRLQKLAFIHARQTSADAMKIEDAQQRLKYLAQEYSGFARKTIDAWWKLAWHVVSKYSDGFIVTGEQAANMTAPGYPEWWLKATSFSSWPGTTYIADPKVSMIERTMVASSSGSSLYYVFIGAAFGVCVAVMAMGIIQSRVRRREYNLI